MHRPLTRCQPCRLSSSSNLAAASRKRGSSLRSTMNGHGLDIE
eukprot:CAMPEP_0177548080 /NCGR_PEP_ID=MMETSP0369-20130122/64246_1 /TAXON_ID=447022 ORGANISM="Scrippsiella hangoei-like, Strain SHHI-4" /NCGR_SAMPLE_ID=MMETSP0369 /ASSEMBLY_ACC=CAM_ASM_000364 /LENGTH=42 /DNA_ID= /DNA_START= /DNA_END= /DNA_ORIENTATION=